MKIKEIRQKSEAQLQKQLKAMREELRDLRFKISNKQYKDVRDLRDLKKDIARVLTVMKEKRVLDSINKKNKEKLDKK